MTLLDNKQFDDGSFECFNFWLADADGVTQVAADDFIVKLCRRDIEAAMKLGKSHIRTRGLFNDGVAILEIQWG